MARTARRILVGQTIIAITERHDVYAIKCRMCGYRFPAEHEGDYPNLCPECSLELADFGLEPDDMDEALSLLF